MGKIKVLNGGLFTTVQDKGRFKYQKFGVPVSGVMDSFSYKIANLLVGNSSGEAVLEATMVGPEIEFLDDTVIAVTGGDLGFSINGETAPMWQAHPVMKGDKISFSDLYKGIRAYIAFFGGIDVPVVMESRSTYVKSGIGGYCGRALKTGDLLRIEDFERKLEEYPLKKVPEEHIPSYSEDIEIRVVMGPQNDFFTEKGIEKLLNEFYTAGMECDRMGIRLDGEEIEHKTGSDIISDAISFGSIQIPLSGKPIIMMADRQTVGGYTKIATVISADLPKLAQTKPGDRIKFKEVSLEEALSAMKENREILNAIENNLDLVEGHWEKYKIKELIKIFDSNSINEIAYEDKEFKISIKK